MLVFTIRLPDGQSFVFKASSQVQAEKFLKDQGLDKTECSITVTRQGDLIDQQGE